MSSNMNIDASGGVQAFKLSDKGIIASAWKKNTEGKFEQLRIKVESTGKIGIQLVTQSANKHLFSDNWGVKVKQFNDSVELNPLGINNFETTEKKIINDILNDPSEKDKTISELFYDILEPLEKQIPVSQLITIGKKHFNDFNNFKNSLLEKGVEPEQELAEAFKSLDYQINLLRTSPQTAEAVDRVKNHLVKASNLLFLAKQPELREAKEKAIALIDQCRDLQELWPAVKSRIENELIKKFEETLELIDSASSINLTDLESLKAIVQESLDEDKAHALYSSIVKAKDDLIAQAQLDANEVPDLNGLSLGYPVVAPLDSASEQIPFPQEVSQEVPDEAAIHEAQSIQSIIVPQVPANEHIPFPQEVSQEAPQEAALNEAAQTAFFAKEPEWKEIKSQLEGQLARFKALEDEFDQKGFSGLKKDLDIGAIAELTETLELVNQAFESQNMAKLKKDVKTVLEEAKTFYTQMTNCSEKIEKAEGQFDSIVSTLEALKLTEDNPAKAQVKFLAENKELIKGNIRKFSNGPEFTTNMKGIRSVIETGHAIYLEATKSANEQLVVANPANEQLVVANPANEQVAVDMPTKVEQDYYTVAYQTRNAMDTRADLFTKYTPPGVPLNLRLQVEMIGRVRANEMQKLLVSMNEGFNDISAESAEDVKAKFEHNNLVDTALINLVASKNKISANPLAPDNLLPPATKKAPPSFWQRMQTGVVNAGATLGLNKPAAAQPPLEIEGETQVEFQPQWNSIGDYFEQTLSDMQRSFDVLQSFSDQEDLDTIPNGEAVPSHARALLDLEGKPLVAVYDEDAFSSRKSDFEGVRITADTLPAVLEHVEKLRKKYGSKWRERELDFEELPAVIVLLEKFKANYGENWREQTQDPDYQQLLKESAGHQSVFREKDAYQELQVQKDMLLSLIAANDNVVGYARAIISKNLDDLPQVAENLEQAGAHYSKGMILDIYKRILVGLNPPAPKDIDVSDVLLGEIPVMINGGSRTAAEGLQSRHEAWEALIEAGPNLEAYGQLLATAEEHVAKNGYSVQLPELLLTNVKKRVATIIETGQVQTPEEIAAFSKELSLYALKFAECLQLSTAALAIKAEISNEMDTIVAELNTEAKALEDLIKNKKYIPEAFTGLTQEYNKAIEHLEEMNKQPKVGYWTKLPKAWSELSIEEATTYGNEIIQEIEKERGRLRELSSTIFAYGAVKDKIAKQVAELQKPEADAWGGEISKPQHHLAYELRSAEERETKNLEFAIKNAGTDITQQKGIANTIKEATHGLNRQLAHASLRDGHEDYLKQVQAMTVSKTVDGGFAPDAPEALAAKKGFIAEEKQRVAIFKEKAKEDFNKLNKDIAPAKDNDQAGIALDAAALQETWNSHLAKLDEVFANVPVDDKGLTALSNPQLVMLRIKRQEALKKCRDGLLEMVAAREKAVGAHAFYDQTVTRATERIAALKANSGPEALINRLEAELKIAATAYARVCAGPFATSKSMTDLAAALGKITGRLAAADNKA